MVENYNRDETKKW